MKIVPKPIKRKANTIANHNELNENLIFATYCVVGDLVVGLPNNGKKILLFNVQNRVVTIVNHS